MRQVPFFLSLVMYPLYWFRIALLTFFLTVVCNLCFISGSIVALWMLRLVNYFGVSFFLSHNSIICKDSELLCLILCVQSFDHGYYLLVKAIQELREKKGLVVTVGIGGPSGSGKTRYSTSMSYSYNNLLWSLAYHWCFTEWKFGRESRVRSWLCHHLHGQLPYWRWWREWLEFHWFWSFSQESSGFKFLTSSVWYFIYMEEILKNGFSWMSRIWWMVGTQLLQSLISERRNELTHTEWRYLHLEWYGM